MPQAVAVPVTVALPIERGIVDYEEFNGRTEAVEIVDIRARVTGYLDVIHFQDGAEVKKGDLLYEIDPRPFIAAHDRSKSQVELCKADVKFREAERKRAETLLPKSAISQSEADQILATYSQAVASLAAAEASERADALNVNFTKVISPINGVTSRSQITRGNLVQADQTVLTTIVSVDPMYAYFNMDDNTILRLQEMVRTGRIQVKNDEFLPVLMQVSEEQGFRHDGVVDFGENRFDPNTGTIRLRGVFPNPKPQLGTRLLMPGLFAKIRIPIGNPRKTLLVADSAIVRDQGQKCVRVVDSNNKVENRPVTVGRLEGGMRVIEKGLNPDERVIVVGGQRVRPGDPVTPELKKMEDFGLLSDTVYSKKPDAAKSGPGESPENKP